MALSSSTALRRILRGSSSPFYQLKFTFLPSRQSSTFPLDEDSGSKELPPLSTPKLFVSGLSRLTTDEKLKEAFSPYGQLLEAKVITDRASGRSKGFGFVSYATIEEADKARYAMNAKFLDGWVIFVDPAKPKERRPFTASPEPEAPETGFRTNKTIGWCG
ncbi:glycine-rich RNA-binding protein 4, mitochondrial [Phalaenopsis equestris]|uniref:glycine-rich RNA-binding protein 4, mitochondrial n=1 Tax=Phalaenopsis equestris TaxID=78828 RepID=UPI0009E360DA|nr:glycine-rich RNA-binding protein 4, mitochondrial [Phalaenopsis equestris]